MNYKIFKKWFDLALKVLVPVSFFFIAIMKGEAFWLGGVMFVIIIFNYALTYFIKDEK